jgi:hypothetical protein
MYDRFPGCAPWCAGHLDDSVPNQHSTDYDYFGPDAVGVTQVDGHPPVVSLFDYSSPQVNFTPAQARLFAYQLMQAAELAERFAFPLQSAAATRALAESLAATA